MPGGHSKPLKPEWHRCPVQYCITKSENRKGFYYVPEHPIVRKDWLNACGIDSSSSITVDGIARRSASFFWNLVQYANDAGCIIDARSK